MAKATKKPKSKKLWMVREDDDANFFLTDDKSYATESRPATIEDETPGALADFMDQEAENANQHDFVGVHRALVDILNEEIMGVCTPSTVVQRIMRRLVDAGGLMELRN